MIVMAHLKRYAMPKSWPLARKKETWVVRPMPGAHALGRSIPLQIVLREILGVAETSKEAKSILNAGKIMVDKKVRKEPKFPVGLMDVIEIPETKKYLRIIPGERRLEFENISAEESNAKLCRIQGKTVLKGGLHQLNLHDGRNVIIGKKSAYKCGDSLVIEIPNQRIVKHYAFEKGSPAFIIAGRNMGTEGTIKKIKRKKSMLEKSVVIMESKGKEIVTLIEYVFPGTVKTGMKVKPTATKPVKETKKPAKPKKPAAKPKGGKK